MKMSKMKMPEMSVVRFTESDVIVASQQPFGTAVYLTGFSNSEKNDGRVYIGTDDKGRLIYFGGHTQGAMDDMNQYFTPTNDNYSFVYQGTGTPHDFQSMVNMDSTGNPVYETDGLYYYNSYGTFGRTQQQ